MAVNFGRVTTYTSSNKGTTGSVKTTPSNGVPLNKGAALNKGATSNQSSGKTISNNVNSVNTIRGNYEATTGKSMPNNSNKEYDANEINAIIDARNKKMQQLVGDSTNNNDSDASPVSPNYKQSTSPSTNPTSSPASKTKYYTGKNPNSGVGYKYNTSKNSSSSGKATYTRYGALSRAMKKSGVIRNDEK